MKYALEAINLSKQYGDKIALNNFNIKIPEASIYGLLGPNGAGKTTFIRMINQITYPDSGEILINGQKLAISHISEIGYMPEERGLYKNMKVGEQAIYFAQLKGLSHSEAKKRAKYWFEKLGIETWWDKKLSELSKGMGQKVQFVITVIHEPKILIFDEPFSGFDPLNAKLIGDEIIELKQKGTTIIFSTHRMETVEEMCDYVALIHLSNKILDGSVEEIKNQFKEGKFKISLKNILENSIENFNKKYEMFLLNTQNSITTFDLNIPSNIQPNELLTDLMQLGEIIQFQEAIPSMNDIFINAVK